MSADAAPVGPFGADVDNLARSIGGWLACQMVHTVEAIGTGKNPQVTLIGSAAQWVPEKGLWSFKGFLDVKAVTSLDEYRAALGGGDGTSK